MKKAVDSVRILINEFSKAKNSELYQIISKMSLADLNRVIYRCDKEERDEGYGFDTYNIPNFGFMVYAGLQGKKEYTFLRYFVDLHFDSKFSYYLESI